MCIVNPSLIYICITSPSPIYVHHQPITNINVYLGELTTFTGHRSIGISRLVAQFQFVYFQGMNGIRPRSIGGRGSPRDSRGPPIRWVICGRRRMLKYSASWRFSVTSFVRSCSESFIRYWGLIMFQISIAFITQGFQHSHTITY